MLLSPSPQATAQGHTAASPRFTNHHQQPHQPHQSASTPARKLLEPRAPTPMALLSDGTDFFARVVVTWLLSATVAVAIVRGWIRGHAFRPKKSHLLVLVYSLALAKEGLTLRMVRGNIPESCWCDGEPECVQVVRAYIWDLVQVADGCYILMLNLGLTLGEAILGKRMPPRPHVPERRGLARIIGILFEILFFIPCVLSCIYELPLLLQDYATSTANGRDAAVA